MLLQRKNDKRDASSKSSIAIARAGRQPFGLGLEAIEEPRVDQQSREGLLDAGFEIAVPPALLVEAQQRVERGVAGIHGPPIRVRRESGQDLARARQLVTSHRRGTAEDGPPARRVAGAGRLERPVDLDAVDAAARRVDAEELVDALAAALVEQRDGQRARPGGHAQPDARPDRRRRAAAPSSVTSMRGGGAEALPRERTGAARADAHLVGRIERKVVRELEAAARPERQAVDVARLRAAGSLVD